VFRRVSRLLEAGRSKKISESAVSFSNSYFGNARLTRRVGQRLFNGQSSSTLLHGDSYPTVYRTAFRAYFTEGRDISTRQTLIDVVADAGLDRHQAEGVLNRGEGLEAIKEAGELSQHFRVDGVPFFIIDGKITLSGAQQPDAFLEAFGQAGRSH
jgi:protein-disulfide isomerase-like protein with CxxC motif